MFQALVESLKAYSLRLRPPQPHQAVRPATLPATLPVPNERRPDRTTPDRAEQLRQARSLLQQASHLARYHQPVLENEIRRFLADTAAPSGDRAANRPTARNLS